MDVERLLVSWIIQHRSLAEVSEANIAPKFFVDRDNRAVFETILQHHAEHSSVPSLAAIKMDYPTYRFTKVDDSVSFLIEKLRENHALSLIEDGLVVAVDAHEKGDPDAATTALAHILGEIAHDLPSTRDVDVSETGIDRLNRYLELRDRDGALLGYPTGFAAIDEATQGFQKEHLVTIVGPPKSGKSTIMLLCAMACWAFGVKPLFFTFEMSNEEMMMRLDAFRARISHHRLQTGRLKKQEWLRLERALNQMSAMLPFWFSADTNSATTLSGIGAKVDKLRPDIVFIDGIYMLDDEYGEAKGSSQALTNITRGTKRMAQNKMLPFVISSQVLEWKMDKKRGITSNSIGYSSSFAQDSNTILGTEKTEDPEINKLKVVLARNCPPMEVFIKWEWEVGEFEELDFDPFSPEAAGGEWDGADKAGF